MAIFTHSSLARRPVASLYWPESNILYVEGYGLDQVRHDGSRAQQWG